MQVPRIKEHLTLNAGKLATYEDARREVMMIVQAAKTWTSGENYNGTLPMDIGGVLQSGREGHQQQKPHQQHPPPLTPSGRPPRSAGACLCCGRQGHVKANCKWKDLQCNVCGKTGHMAAVCKHKQAQPQGKNQGGKATPPSKGQGRGKGKGKGKDKGKGVNAVEASEEPAVTDTLVASIMERECIMSVSVPLCEKSVVAGVSLSHDYLMADSGAM
eukprot:1572069-Amphidinium_carterae.1